MLGRSELAMSTLPELELIELAYLTFSWVAAIDPVELWIPCQSLIVGLVASVLPLVSPPTVSSWMEVNTTGLLAVPWILSVPSACKRLWSNLRIVPAEIVRVLPLGMVREPTWYDV